MLNNYTKILVVPHEAEASLNYLFTFCAIMLFELFHIIFKKIYKQENIQ